MFDNACDLYKEMREKELCGLGERQRLWKIANSDYELSLSEPPKTIKKLSIFDEMEKALKESEL